MGQKRNASYLLKVYARFFPKIYFGVGLVATIFNAAVIPCYGWLVGSFLDRLSTNPDGLKETFIPLFAALAIMASVSGMLGSKMFGTAAGILSTNLQLAIFRSMLSKDIEDLDTASSGRYTALLIGEVEAIATSVKDGFPQLILGLLVVVYQVGITFYHSYIFGLLDCGVCLMIFLATFFPLKKIRATVGKKFSASSKLSQFVPETISGIKTIRVYQWETEAIGYFSKESSKIASAEKSLASLVSMGTAAGFLSTYGIAVLAAYISTVVYGQGISIGQISILFSSITTSTVFMRLVSTKLIELTKAEKAASNIKSALISKSTIHNVQLKSELIYDKGIQMQEVHFKYKANPRNVLGGVNISIGPGIYAIVGLSGSGKTTIANLLLGLYKDFVGVINFFGADLQTLDSQIAQQVIGFVSQEPFIFTGTIEDNIRMGLGNLTLNDVEEASKLAGIHSAILEMADGFKTIVNKSSLSGGQKQRICLARALAKKPKLLILDEPTSALDGISESHVSESLQKIAKQGVSVLIVAHRLNTVKNADKIFVIESGTVVEEGTYPDLMERQGIFFQLSQHQLASTPTRQRSTTI